MTKRNKKSRMNLDNLNTFVSSLSLEEAEKHAKKHAKDDKGFISLAENNPKVTLRTVKSDYQVNTEYFAQFKNLKK